MPLKFVEHYTPDDCAAHRDWLYVFGDNFARRGKGGQAVIRDEPNACGIATKRLPKWSEDAYLTDADYDEWVQQNEDARNRIEAHLASGGVVVWPIGIGMGRANLQSRAPEILDKIHAWVWDWRDRFGLDGGW